MAISGNEAAGWAAVYTTPQRPSGNHSNPADGRAPVTAYTGVAQISVIF